MSAATAAQAGVDPPKPEVPPAPDIVHITTDDQSALTFTPEVMPQTFRYLAQGGTVFDDMVVTSPLCCPSRAIMLTGQYGHNNGVLGNDYSGLRQKQVVMPVWLRRAGYRTAHIGKFLNGYEQHPSDPATPAPGWDEWFTQLAPRQYYGWKASHNGKVRHFRFKKRDHLTAVTTRKANRYVRHSVGQSRPYYLQLNYFAPHGGRGSGTPQCRNGPKPEPRDIGAFDYLQLPAKPSYDEADVGDKPPSMSERPPLSERQHGHIQRRFRCEAEALQGVDRGIGRIYRTIRDAERLDQTVFVFNSDNGYLYGEHRLPPGKMSTYHEVWRVPFLMKLPETLHGSEPPPPTSPAPAATIDVAPTLLRLAGATPCSAARCRTPDGRSLLPILQGEAGFPEQRDRLLEIDFCSRFTGLISDGEVVIHRTGVIDREVAGGCRDVDETEHYDLIADPYELDNLWPGAGGPDPSTRQRDLLARMEELLGCSSIPERSSTPPTGTYCD